MNPTIEVSSAETVAAEITSHMKTVPATTISTRVTIIDTSAPSGNERKNSAINFSYTVSSFFNPKVFSVETLVLTVPTMGLSQEKGIAPIALDSAEVDVLYRSIIQCQFFSTGDLMMTDELYLPPGQP